MQQRLGEVAKPYVIVLVLSLIVGVLVVAFGGELLDWKSAILAGFTWDSIIQKVQGK